MTTKQQWAHDALAIDLANSLRGEGRMVWTDIQLGPVHSPRPDVYTILKSFTQPCSAAFEIKVSRSDFLADVTAGKWTKYQRYAYTITFACVAGLIQKADVPEQCGLIWRHDNVWRYAKRPTVNPIVIPQDAWVKLLIDGVEREGPKARAKQFNIDNGFAKRYGSEAARWVTDAASVKDRVQYAEDDIRIRKELAQAEATRIRESARRDGGDHWRMLLQALDLPEDTDVWTARRAVNDIERKTEGAIVDRSSLARVRDDVARVHRVLDGLLTPLMAAAQREG